MGTRRSPKDLLSWDGPRVPRLWAQVLPGSPWEPWSLTNGHDETGWTLYIHQWLTGKCWPFILSRNQRGSGFMHGWTSQTDRAFYQMQYLTGHETDEMKMVIGISQYDSYLDPGSVFQNGLLPRFVDSCRSEINIYWLHMSFMFWLFCNQLVG